MLNLKIYCSKFFSIDIFWERCYLADAMQWVEIGSVNSFSHFGLKSRQITQWLVKWKYQLPSQRPGAEMEVVFIRPKICWLLQEEGQRAF